jgi:hypothetical protein
VAERPIAPALKADVPRGTGGSNPPASAPAQVIFDFLAQPANHVRLDTSGMLRTTPDQPSISGAGQTFLITMQNEDKGEDGGDTEVSQTYDWSEFSHVEALPYLPLLGREQLEESLVRLAEVIEGS